MKKMQSLIFIIPLSILAIIFQSAKIIMIIDADKDYFSESIMDYVSYVALVCVILSFVIGLYEFFTEKNETKRRLK